MDLATTLIVDPSRLSREGLRLLLSDPPYKALHASSVEEYIGRNDVVRPDLVIWGSNVLDAALQRGISVIRSRFADATEPVRHVVLVNAFNTRAIRRLAALNVEAILLADISGEVLNRSLDLVMLGQRIFPVARSPVRRSRQEALPPPVTNGSMREEAPADVKHQVVLSGRESQILQHLVGGASNKTIARELQITEATVKVHIKSLLRKTRVANRTQAAIWALHNRYRVIGEDDPTG